MPRISPFGAHGSYLTRLSGGGTSLTVRVVEYYVTPDWSPFSSGFMEKAASGWFGNHSDAASSCARCQDCLDAVSGIFCTRGAVAVEVPAAAAPASAAPAAPPLRRPARGVVLAACSWPCPLVGISARFTTVMSAFFAPCVRGAFAGCCALPCCVACGAVPCARRPACAALIAAPRAWGDDGAPVTL